MVAGRHNLSRRAVLGACVGVPALLGAPPAPARGQLLATVPIPASAAKGGQGPVPVPDRWTRALAAFRRAEARLSAFRVEVAHLPPAARAYPAGAALDDRFDDLEDTRLAALRRLLRAPAPDLPALALKLELTIDDQAWELTNAEPCLAALKADTRSLATTPAGVTAHPPQR